MVYTNEIKIKRFQLNNCRVKVNNYKHQPIYAFTVIKELIEELKDTFMIKVKTNIKKTVEKESVCEKTVTHQIMDNSFIYYQPKIFVPNENQMNDLWSLRPLDAQYCKIFNKDVAIPRRHKTLGKSYQFNGSVTSDEPFNEVLTCVAERITRYFEVGMDGELPNSCLVNWYEDGDEYIGYHSDNERNLVPNKPIFIVSLGAERCIKMKNKKTNEVVDFILENGSLFVMGGDTQKTHKHSIPKSKTIKEKRISLTFRYLK